MARLVKHLADYTLVGNACVRDRSLSYKAIGMLVQLLSVDSESWSFSERGLAALHPDGQTSVRSARKELERAGYLFRERARDESGRLAESVYHVFPEPRTKGFDLGYTGFVDSTDTDSDLERFRRSEPECENRTLGLTSANSEVVDNLPEAKTEGSQIHRSGPNCGFPSLDGPNLEKPSANKEYIDKRTSYLSSELSVGAHGLSRKEREAASVLGSGSGVGSAAAFERRDDVREFSDSGISHGLRPVDSTSGELVSPSNDSTPSATAWKSTANGVSETEISASTNGEMPLEADFNISECRAVSPESPSGAVGASVGGAVDWHLLADTLPLWMFRALNDDVARQSTGLVRQACALGWTTSDLRVALEANPMPQRMSSPAGLVLTRVRQACAKPAPSLLAPSGIDGREQGGLRDFSEELDKTRRYVRNFWLQHGVSMPEESAESIRNSIDSLSTADLPWDAREELGNRFERLLALCESQGRWSA